MKSKLIRHKIYDKIAVKESHRIFRIEPTHNVELFKRILCDKLIEEARELSNTTSYADTIEELADVIEVVNALQQHHQVPEEALEACLTKKREENGDLTRGTMLVLDDE